MNMLMISFRNIVLMTFLLGGVYPVLVYGLGQILMYGNANGSLVSVQGSVKGSYLIAQKFTRLEYFWSRPSAVDYNSASAGASQKSVTSADLRTAYIERSTALGNGAPSDMLYASGSGLDPHISVEAANFQKNRVAQARKIDVQVVEKLIDEAREGRTLGFMGQPRVNVLKLNILLDNSK